MKTFDDLKRFNQLNRDVLYLESCYKTWDVIWDSLRSGDDITEDHGIPYTSQECDLCKTFLARELGYLEGQIMELEMKWEDES